MTVQRLWQVPSLVVAVAVLAAFPFFGNGYYISFGINLLQFVVLATAWTLFSGPTRYISLATAAFFGIGAYTMAVLSDAMPLYAVIAAAALVGVAVALIVGLATLRLRGIFFVIFTFGLAELIRQLVAWYEIKVSHTVGRYIFLDVGQEQIFWELLALAVLVFLVGWLVGRSRLGLALNVIGNDETVARHVAINTTAAKLVLFAVSAAFMSATGAIMAPRYTYIDPALAFNPMLSFQVVIMALLGGTGRLYGPLFGVVPLSILLETIAVNFPNHFNIVLGVVFIVIVYFLPNGVIGLADRWKGGGLRALVPLRAAGRPQAMTKGALLEIDQLTKTFGGLIAVSNLTMSVDEGEIVGLIGPNGSGKTTALNLISGALKPDAGEIRLRGHDISGLPANQIARLGIARTFQLVRVLEFDELPRQRHRRPRLPPQSAVGAGGEEARRGAARSRRAGKPGRCPGRATDLYRPETTGTRPRAGARPAGPAARRMAGGAQSARARYRRGTHPLAARGGPDRHSGGARHGRHPLALRPLRGDECRPEARRRHARASALRPRGDRRLYRRCRCLGSPTPPPPTASTWRLPTSTSRSTAARSW